MNSFWYEKARAYLQLVRLPNIFTAMADVLAGYFIVSGTHLVWAELFGLMVGSAALYAGGCVLNDLCDWEVDTRERPFRPLPSGRVPLWKAVLLLCFLFGTGLACIYGVGGWPFVVGAILAALIISYDAITKDRPVLGPLNMGACRSCNLILGMSSGPPLLSSVVLFPLLTLVYVCALTILSRFEVNDGLGRRGWIVSAGWAGVVLALLGLGLSRQMVLSGLFFLGLFALFTGPALFLALLKPTPGAVGRAVKYMVLGIPLLDAVYSSGVQGWPYGVVVALCILPAVFLSRYLYVT
jgi:4-hydroxybenzoate polyprenyltransferase